MCWSVYSWGTISTLKTINSIYTPTERYSEKCRWRISLSLSYTFFFSFPYRLFIYRTWSPIESECSALSDPSTDRHRIVCMLAREENGSWSNEMESQNPPFVVDYISPPIHCRHSTEGLVGDGNKVVPPLYSQRSEMRFLLFLFFFIELL
jgi:hypothetical protein